jgi:hypothetical protein
MNRLDAMWGGEPVPPVVPGALPAGDAVTAVTGPAREEPSGKGHKKRKKKGGRK